jgi:cytochrome o ubiquinol oxidase operon protein cyoD
MSRAQENARELRSYFVGYGLALVLSIVPFTLVAWGGLTWTTTLWTIAAFALVQIVVHFRFFLHIDLSGQKREDLQLILFSALLFTLMAGGTIWIMANLHVRMM